MALLEQMVPFPRPMKVNPNEDDCESWEAFRESFEHYALITELYKEEPEIQVAKFRSIFGDDNRKILRNLDVTKVDEDKTDEAGKSPCKNLKNILRALEARFSMRRNVLFQRYSFYKCRQAEGEKVKDFCDRLRMQAKKRGFHNAEKVMVRDILILGTNVQAAREACFKEEETKLDLEKTISILEMYEDNAKTLKEIEQNKAVSATDTVWAVDRGGSKRALSSAPPQRSCFNCGRAHPPRKCPAYMKTCAKCQKLNHFAAVCRSGKTHIHQVQTQQPAENQETTKEYEDIDDIYAVESLGAKKVRKICIDLELVDASRKKHLKAYLDTGATINVISERMLQEIGETPANIRREHQLNLRMFNNTLERTLGTTAIPIRINGREIKLKFQVLRKNVDTLLSAKTCIDLELIRLAPVVECISQI